VTRWIVRGVLFVALVVGVFGLLPRLGGLTHDAAGFQARTAPANPSSAAMSREIRRGAGMPFR
jgi:hypothetical protein